MQDRLDTYSVWEALKEDSECLLCALRRKTERQLIDRSLGGAVMSPYDRQRVNAAGFCQHHHQQLFEQKNRLGHALLTLSRLQTLMPQVKKALSDADIGEGARRRGLFSGKQTAADSPLQQLTARCMLCEALEDHSSRQADTLIYLFERDPAFREQFAASKGLCLMDASRLLPLAQQMRPAQRQAFLEALQKGLQDNLQRLEKELNWYTQKFDYRNQDAPWGDSKDALERTVNKLRGWCLGPEPMEDDAH